MIIDETGLLIPGKSYSQVLTTNPRSRSRLNLNQYLPVMVCLQKCQLASASDLKLNGATVVIGHDMQPLVIFNTHHWLMQTTT